VENTPTKPSEQPKNICGEDQSLGLTAFSALWMLIGASIMESIGDTVRLPNVKSRTRIDQTITAHDDSNRRCITARLFQLRNDKNFLHRRS
jgi:hypothetical protein